MPIVLQYAASSGGFETSRTQRALSAGLAYAELKKLCDAERYQLAEKEVYCFVSYECHNPRCRTQFMESCINRPAL